MGEPPFSSFVIMKDQTTRNKVLKLILVCIICLGTVTGLVLLFQSL